jgi:hypothetical protein
VWHYAEANLVEQSMKQGPAWVSMVNTVIGAVRPVIDYVSISVGGDSLREVNPAPALHKVHHCCYLICIRTILQSARSSY